MFLFNKNEYLFSICRGHSIPIEKVPDSMFSKKILGDGVGFILEDNKIYSPCDGKVTMIANTKHALGILSKKGIEIMIHIGLDTVKLNGKGFQLFVSDDEEVKKGQLLIQLDKQYMAENGIDLTSVMIVLNNEKYALKKENNNEKVDLNSRILTIKMY